MTVTPTYLRIASALGAALLLLAACGDDSDSNSKTDIQLGSAYPKTEEDKRKERVGKLTGDEGLLIGGGSEKKGEEYGKNPLGVNSFLWRASLDTLSFMPFASADPFGGVILTEWYEDPDAPGERFKVNVLITDRQLRADSLKISVFRQKKDKLGNWVDAPIDASMGRKLEDTVLTRARQLRVAQLGN